MSVALTSSLSRRRFLRGPGALLGLPLLESLMPRELRSAVQAGTTRLGFVYLPNGVVMDKWRARGTGDNWELSPSLAPLRDVKARLQVISGLKHDKAAANGDGGGDHARATATFLTGTQARKTAGADIQAGISVDQIAARSLAHHTRIDSLQLGCDPGRRAGQCDSGYSCAYQFNFSWKSPTLPLAPEIDPRLIFERIFGGGPATESPGSRQRRLAHERSLLDFVLDDAKALRGQLGATDQRKMDEYLNAVREVELRVEDAERFQASLPKGIRQPEGIPSDYREHLRMIYDLMVLAYQSNTTRVITFLTAHDGSNRSFGEIGVPEAHHQLSHHQRNPAHLAKLEKIDLFYAEQFAYFLGKMEAVREPDGRSLLDSSMIVFGGGISDGDRHNHDDLPVILAGGGNGQLRTGRHLVCPEPVPMTNLYLSLLDRMGVKEERLGDSTGRFDLI